MPDAEVAIGLYGQPLSPFLRSNVHVWAGPPLMNRTMHDLARFRVACSWATASAATTSSQPETLGPTAPTAASFSKSRRLHLSNSLLRCTMARGSFWWDQ